MVTSKSKFVLASCLLAGLSFKAMASGSQDDSLILENNADYSHITTSESGLTFGFKDDGNIHKLELEGPTFKVKGSLGSGWPRFLAVMPTTNGAVYNTGTGSVNLKVGASGYSKLGSGFRSRSLAVVDRTLFILTSTDSLWSKPLAGGRGVNLGKIEGATQMVSVGNNLVFFFDDGSIQTSKIATPGTLTRIGRDWGDSTKIYPFSETHFLIESGSGTIFLKSTNGNSRRIGAYRPGLLVGDAKRLYKLANGRLVFQAAGGHGQIARAPNNHQPRQAPVRIHRYMGHRANLRTLAQDFPTVIERIKAARGRQGTDHIGEGTDQRFLHWAQNGLWQEFGPARNHYDWWMFPQKARSGTSQLSQFYALSTEDITALLTDYEFMQSYLSGINLMFQSWGWNIETGEVIMARDENQKWKHHNIRFIKLRSSLQSFMETSDVDNIWHDTLNQYYQNLPNSTANLP